MFHGTGGCVLVARRQMGSHEACPYARSDFVGATVVVARNPVRVSRDDCYSPPTSPVIFQELPSLM